ncbi:MAG: element excision factor XisH family protein [Bacteroidota bacterium]
MLHTTTIDYHTFDAFALEKEVKEIQKIKIIYVEIKSMLKTLVYDFYQAYGQYEFYRESLEDEGIPHPIYLAIPMKAYERVNDVPVLARWIKKHRINLLVIDVEKEEIVKWITY